jgi:hypothetical protein
MTVLGKILVFVNLVFSLVTAGLIVMVYTTRVNWNKAYNDQKLAANVARQDAATAEAEKAEEIKRRDALYQTLKAEKDRMAGEVRTLNDQLAKSKTDFEQAIAAQTKGQQVTVDQTKELERRKTEVETQKKLVEDRDKRIADIDRQMARLRDEAVQYRIQWEQSKERINILQGQVEQYAREADRLRQQAGGASSPVTSGSAYAAGRIEDLKGTIQQVSGDLATITPGSDAGVAVGVKLRVFHLLPKPEYLGDLTILSVTPTQAVGRLSGPKARQVKGGDEVDAK